MVQLALLRTQRGFPTPIRTCSAEVAYAGVICSIDDAQSIAEAGIACTAALRNGRIEVAGDVAGSVAIRMITYVTSKGESDENSENGENRLGNHSVNT
jgi:hypothetical protein